MQYPQPAVATSITPGYEHGAPVPNDVHNGSSYGGYDYRSGMQQQQYDMSGYQYPQQHHQQFMQHHQLQYNAGDSGGTFSSHQGTQHVAYPNPNHSFGAVSQQQQRQVKEKRIPAGEHRQSEDGTAIFKLSVEREDGEHESATVQVALDGVKVLDAAGSLVKRIYGYDAITCWKLRDYPGVSDRLQLTLWTQSSVDENEKALTLLASGKVLKLVADTMTCNVMQFCEMIPELGETPNMGVRVNGDEVENPLFDMGEAIHSAVFGVEETEDIEFWNGAEKSGWMMSKGEHIKNWRRRYFVLKQRHLFRFLTSDIDETTKPRGVIDLRQVTDVCEVKENLAMELFGKSMPFQSAKCHLVLTLFGDFGGKFRIDIASEDEQEMQEWAISIRSAADEAPAKRKTHSDYARQIALLRGESTSGGDVSPQGVVNVHDHSRGDNGRSPPPLPRAPPTDVYKWQPAYTNDGRVYYYNTETGETKWEL